MVSSMLSVFLPRSSRSLASSQSPTRRSIPSAQRSSSPSSMRMTTPQSFSGTLCRQTPCRLTTLPSNKKSWHQTTCAWGGPVVVGQISSLETLGFPGIMYLWVFQVPFFFSHYWPCIFLSFSLFILECIDIKNFPSGSCSQVHQDDRP